MEATACVAFSSYDLNAAGIESQRVLPTCELRHPRTGPLLSNNFVEGLKLKYDPQIVIGKPTVRGLAVVENASSTVLSPEQMHLGTFNFTSKFGGDGTCSSSPADDHPKGFRKASGRAMADDISMYARRIPSEEHLDDAVQMVDLMMKHNIRVSINTFSTLLQRCTWERDLRSGKQVHKQLLENGYKSNILLANTLVDLYGKCGSPQDAQKVFDEMPKHNTYSWSAIIAAYANHGLIEEAVNLLQKADQQLDKMVFLTVLQACASIGDLSLGKQVHEEINRSAYRSDLSVRNALIDMYAKCGKLDTAYEMFSQLSEHNADSWTAMITAYGRKGLQESAFSLFEQMLYFGVEPDEDTFSSLLQICTESMNREQGVLVHAQIVAFDYEMDPYVDSSLVEMYAKGKNLERACIVFNKMHGQNLASWNALIIAFIEHGFNGEALTLFQQMQPMGVEPDEITYLNIIQACSNLAALEEGRLVHDQIVKFGLISVNLENSLFYFYAKLEKSM